MKGKDIKFFVPIMYVNGTYWAALTKEAYYIYMIFKKCSYIFYDVRVIIKYDYASLHKFLNAYTLNSKVNNKGTEIAIMSHVTFEHIKGISNILTNIITCLRFIHLHDSLHLDGQEKELGHDISEELHLINAETPAQIKQNETLIYEL